jgi:dynein heavy chain
VVAPLKRVAAVHHAQVTILSADWKRLLLRLCLFHALLMERQQYRALGWRRPYEFTAADVLSSINQVMSIIHTTPSNGIDDCLQVRGGEAQQASCLTAGRKAGPWCAGAGAAAC